MEFVDSTYAAAATLANWDRAALEPIRARDSVHRLVAPEHIPS